MRILVLQHIACEPPGVYGDVLAERGATIDRVALDENEPLPDWCRYEGIVAMGGPMSVNDDATLGWLRDEKRLIGDAVRAGVAYWGVCLGAQLLAASLDAKVYPGPSPEVGLLPVALDAAATADAVFHGLPSSLMTFQWHNETFDLPAGSTLLASSLVCRSQAFRWGRRAYGVQFHLEVSADMARQWAGVVTYASDLERVLGPGSLPRLITDLERHGGSLNATARTIFRRWLDLIA